jgi:acetylornithine deacetylase/succinyl-diaminopimelate desuccinylase-like protein
VILMTALDSAREYARGKRPAFLEQLKDFLRIPSISTLSERAPDIRRAAEWVASEMRRIGLTTAQVYDTPGHPVVFGSWLGVPGAPTVLVYGHYDVQPVDPENEWVSGPFDPTVRDGKLYARGAVDDKGQVFVNLKALEALMQAGGGTLPFNVKLLIEGEEEISSINLDAFIASHLDLLAADVCVISDTAMLGLDKPSIVYGLRGLTYMEIEVRGPVKDLHSGQFGGAVHNPAQALCEIITALHNADGSISVKGFYDKVRPLSPAERQALAAVSTADEQEQSLRQITGVSGSWGEATFTVSERTGARPTLEVNGLVGGFIGEGAKTVLPAKALAKVSCRLVPDQDPNEIYGLVRDHVASITPPTVTSEVRLLHVGDAAVVPIDSPAMGALVDALTQGFGKAPVFQREGGSIPVVATFRRQLGTPVLLAGYGLPDDGAHGPNEKFDLECLYRGIDTAIILYERLSHIPLDQFKV